MSVFWEIYRARGLDRMRATVNLVVFTKEPVPDIMDIVTDQIAWWNRQSVRTRPEGGRVEAEVTFRLEARRATPAEQDAPGLARVWSGEGSALRFRDWRDDYFIKHTGVGLVLAGAAGQHGAPWASHTVLGGITMWTEVDYMTDRAGAARSAVLMHELGHTLGLIDRYRDHDPSRRGMNPREAISSDGERYRTVSNRGWRNNVMADLANDRGVHLRRGRTPDGIWLAWSQARNMASKALLAARTFPSPVWQGGAEYYAREVERPWRD